MSKQVKQGGKKGRKIGRASRKPKTAKYLNTNRRQKNKLRRILKSNGKGAAIAYADEHALQGYLEKRLNRGYWKE